MTAASLAIVPTEQTLSRIDAGQTFLHWIMPRLSGSADEKETTLVMLLAQFGERYAQGIHDAGDVLRLLSEGKPGSHDLSVAANALASLERRTRAMPVTSL